MASLAPVWYKGGGFVKIKLQNLLGVSGLSHTPNNFCSLLFTNTPPLSPTGAKEAMIPQLQSRERGRMFGQRFGESNPLSHHDPRED